MTSKITFPPNPLAGAGFGTLTYIDRKLSEHNQSSVPIANPFSQVGWGALTYIDRTLIESPKEPRTLLSVSINDKCNLECPHCIESQYLRGDDNYPTLIRRFQELEPNSVVWFSIAGKEPTLSPERLIETARIVRQKANKVIVMTNGIELTPKLQEQLHDVDYLDISVDGSNPSTAYKSSERVSYNIKHASINGFQKVSVLTTLINDSHENWNRVGELSDVIADTFDGNVAHSIGFYLGWPKDTRVLTKEQVLESIRNLVEKDFKTTIQIPLLYSRFLPSIFREFQIKPETKRFDSSTGIPSYDLNGHNLVPTSHLETPLYGLRVEVDGNVYFGCSHLMIKGDASEFAVGNLNSDSLSEIIKRVTQKGNAFMEEVSSVRQECYESPCFKFCRGGDRVGGYVHIGIAVDPFCQLEEVCSN